MIITVSSSSSSSSSSRFDIINHVYSNHVFMRPVEATSS